MKIISALFLIILPGYLFAQVDSLPALKDTGEIRYLYKGDLFPWDSGVGMSDAQYQFIYRNEGYKQIKSTVTTAITQVPRVIYVDRPVRNKGDGNKLVWGGGGVAAGIVLTIIIKVLIWK